eukprot:g2944.t1
MGNPQRGTKKKKQNKKGRAYNVVRKQHGGKPKDHDQVHDSLKPENRTSSDYADRLRAAFRSPPRLAPARTAIVFAGVSGATEILDANLRHLILPFQPAHVYICGVDNFPRDEKKENSNSLLFEKWHPFIKGVNFSPHPRSNPLMYTHTTARDIVDSLGISQEEYDADPEFHKQIFNHTSTNPWTLVHPLNQVLDLMLGSAMPKTKEGGESLCSAMLSLG